MPLSEFKRNHFLCSPMPKLEPPCRTQRQACYGWAVSKTRLVIAMPPDAITAIPIEIEQNCVVRRAGDVFRPFAQSLNDRWKPIRAHPRLRLDLNGLEQCIACSASEPGPSLSQSWQ